MPRRAHAERRASAHDVLRTLRGGKVDGAAEAAAIEQRLGPVGSYVLDFVMGDIWSRPGLARRDRSLVVISILTTLNQLNQLRSHVRGGWHHGLTRAEIEEIMVQLAAYAGFPRAIDGMTVAREVLAELTGVAKLEPSAPAARKEDAERGKDAREVIGRIMANQPPGGIDIDMGDFAGTAGRWAFGEIWSRTELSRRDRSLVVCATLVTQDKPTELEIHVQAALNHGLTVIELEELLYMVIGYVGFPTAVEGFRTLRKVQGRSTKI
jgi:4-carboxymuconolactone decarboxylase